MQRAIHTTVTHAAYRMAACMQQFWLSSCAYTSTSTAVVLGMITVCLSGQVIAYTTPVDSILYQLLTHMLNAHMHVRGT